MRTFELTLAVAPGLEADDELLPADIPVAELRFEPARWAQDRIGRDLPAAVETDEGFLYEVEDLGPLLAGLEEALETLDPSERAPVEAALRVFEAGRDHHLPVVLRV